MDVYTLGHSTHPKEEFISLLRKYQIELLVDVRSLPGSRYVPQFDKEKMEAWLPENGIKYLHMPELGGRRNKNKDVDITLVHGWHNASLRNYAAYTFTDGYKEGINKLIKLSEENKLCYMCSEALPWRCHRWIISDTLVSKGINVFHIMSEGELMTHELGKYGAIPEKMGSQLIYPAAPISKLP